ncbi:polysaccharide deacetylase family protein [Sulfuriferula nivalis]|uniref:Polysaccharide deacetylase n=1 Tax=Sulfuriferula nivalis TaxID=2675298 RepID=A0A809SB41_9PROT|nr:polysaccharide deacetylase family protein [Sulfuriferula nivalis]BBP02453.1 polysaccharide deacetylase [Sulfuriferula nivalis]
MLSLRSVKRRLSPLSLAAALCLCLTHTSTVFASDVGPSVVAKADQSLWNEPINTVNGFNLASRASILVYLLALQDMQKMSDKDMLESFKIKSINRGSVDKWLAKEYKQSWHNYQFGAKNCISSDWTCVEDTSSDALLKAATSAVQKIPNDLKSWAININTFSHSYIAEQLRLAALFPKVSSEIDLFNNNEWNGDMVQDRQFFLTFDDGPTNAQGTTDQTLKMLAAQNKSATFFVLGENFQARLNNTSSLAMTELYGSQCVGLHGWEHQSHAKWDQWQDSIKKTKALVNANLQKNSALPLFRPPYGQRKADSGDFFQSQSLHVALWNIDSQDWNNHVDVNDIINRITTLMLIKRHGVILFHDIHPKAKVAVPAIIEKLGLAVNWMDCHQLNSL